MVSNLLKAGFLCTIYDINPTPVEALATEGATSAQSAAEVAKSSDIFITMVVNDAQLVATLFKPGNAAAALKPGATVMVYLLGPVAEVRSAFAPDIGDALTRLIHRLVLPYPGHYCFFEDRIWVNVQNTFFTISFSLNLKYNDGLVGQLSIIYPFATAAPDPAKRRRRARSRRRRRLPFQTKGVGCLFQPATVCSNHSMICWALLGC
jgi:NAD binding domain of 6-phosphogluconate dehydrogenase